MRGLSLSPDNNLYISNCWTHSILKVDKNNGETATLADSKLEFGPFFALLDPCKRCLNLKKLYQI